MHRAKDIMNTNVIAVRPSTAVEELARILIDHRISGAPVVNESGDLLGIVTENDLISRNKRLHIPTIIRLFDAYIMLESPSQLEKEIKRMAGVTVEDIFTREAVTVTEDATIEDIATIMSERHIHHIPVVREGKLVGIIGKMDMIKGMAK